MLLLDDLGAIAQLVEQWIEAPCVGGSIPPCAIFVLDTTINYQPLNFHQFMLQVCLVTRFNSVAVITSPCHGEERGFDSH